jgi:tellurite resistance protein TerC
MHSIGTPTLWIGFILVVAALIALDLGVVNRRPHAIGYKESLLWSAVWIVLSLLFGAGLGYQFGSEAGITFLTGYLIEKSLSADNLFVIAMVFGSFRIPLKFQHRVLFWGILTAMVLRASMILAGTAMLARFHWLLYLFGAFLVFTGIKLFLNRYAEEGEHPEEKWLMRSVRKIIPTTHELHGAHFFVRLNGHLKATPLFIALIVVEISDVIFALDSIPAIFAITLDPFIVFTSNICAIMGLRSLYFLIAHAIDKFEYLKVGLSVVLTFIGVKMLVGSYVHVSSAVSLAVVLGVLAISIGLSLLKRKRAAPAVRHHHVKH